MEKINFNSIRVQLFLILTSIILGMLLFLIILNNLVFTQFYTYTKTNDLKQVFNTINGYSNDVNSEETQTTIEKLAINNGFDIIIKDGEIITLYTSNSEIGPTINQLNQAVGDYLTTPKEEILEEDSKYYIIYSEDTRTNIRYITLTGVLENDSSIVIRVPISMIEESVSISNSFLYLMAGITIFLSAIIIVVVLKKFTNPIIKIKKIAKNVSNLDFSEKYIGNKSEGEIYELGQSINIMSDKLEKTIRQLKNSNIELEKDIEEKSKIDEMRKTFISDVSHELKTPIALIQGYSEGLLENINSDPESRKFYAEVILDETNKMDRLVKQLLELMKLEYGKREFNDREFNIVELEKEVIRKSTMLFNDENIEVQIIGEDNMNIFADDFYVEQVFSNYITNALKHIKEVDGKKSIIITNKIDESAQKLKISVFNTGENIGEEDLIRIWNRFYKTDESRNRERGGTGIGLAFVKAIMNNYGNDYGVINKENGVEFYIEFNLNK